MKKPCLILCLLLLTASVLNAQVSKPYFQQKSDYHIEVTLHDSDHTLDGYEILHYTNNSPDTLDFIWFHLWPNAFKNDATAYSESLLQLGWTDFYFSTNDQKGYINRLDFKVNGITAQLDNGSPYIDLAKLLLPQPLAPGSTIEITTPFHEKLPAVFSREKYRDHNYRITYWYPQPAVFDNRGWHPVPFLPGGTAYNEFGNYDVRITVPEDYVVAATGILQSTSESNWLMKKSGQTYTPPSAAKIHPFQNARRGVKPVEKSLKKQKALPPRQLKNPNTFKTLRYLQDSITSFAWFADPSFLVRTDTLHLSSGRIIRAWSFFTPKEANTWKNCTGYLKKAVSHWSKWMGEYPYDIITAVSEQNGTGAPGEAYPTLTGIAHVTNSRILAGEIEHEVGLSWNGQMLSPNGIRHPWMWRAVSSYLDHRSEVLQSPDPEKEKFPQNRLPKNPADLNYRMQISSKRDQPIETSSSQLSAVNYRVIAGTKSGLWMQALERHLGEPLFDSCIHTYFRLWKFRHPYPQDFKKVVEGASGKNEDSLFALLDKKGPLGPVQHSKLKWEPLFSFRNTDRYRYLFVSPSVGYNYYDRFMIGGLIHNYTLPEPIFHFMVSPLYAPASQSLNGIGRVGYNILSYGPVRKVEISLSGASFDMDSFTDSAGKNHFLRFSKLVPSLRITFRNRHPSSSATRFIQWKTFLIREAGLLLTIDPSSGLPVVEYPKSNRYLNQLQGTIEDSRALYPYFGNLKIEQGSDFIRLGVEGKYFFNYPRGGGMNVRLFGGKFMYLGGKTITKEFVTDRYHLNMTGPNGSEDYTYSNYFVGRNEFQGLLSRQIMMGDGGFKVRSDLLASKIGKTDSWLAAANFATSIPKQMDPLGVLPVKIPLKLFLDVGTYAEAWQKNAAGGRFIYDAGLQVPLLKGLVNFYFPVLCSKVYRDYFKSTIAAPRFWKTLSFSIDIQNFRFLQFFNLPGVSRSGKDF